MKHEKPRGFSIHLMLGPQPDSQPFLSHVGPGLAIFAEPTVTYQEIADLGVKEAITPGRLGAAFFDAVGTCLETTSSPAAGERDLEECRSLLIDAASAAFDRFPEAAAKGIGAIQFSLLLAGFGDRWKVFNLGSNEVLMIATGEVSQVVEPNTAFYETKIGQTSAETAESLAGIATAMLEPGLRHADEIRAAEVELGPGDWLVVAPGSSAATGLQLAEQPNNLADIEREVIGRLAAPYAAYTRSWLSIHALPIEETHTGPRQHTHG